MFAKSKQREIKSIDFDVDIRFESGTFDEHLGPKRKASKD